MSPSCQVRSLLPDLRRYRADTAGIHCAEVTLNWAVFLEGKNEIESRLKSQMRCHVDGVERASTILYKLEKSIIERKGPEAESAIFCCF